jgi:hypothetical protein
VPNVAIATAITQKDELNERAALITHLDTRNLALDAYCITPPPSTSVAKAIV